MPVRLLLSMLWRTSTTWVSVRRRRGSFWVYPESRICGFAGLRVILTQSLYLDFAVLNSLQAIGLVALTALLILQGFQVSGLKDSLSETSEALVSAESEIQEAKDLIEIQNTAISNLVYNAYLKDEEGNAKAEVIKQDLPAIIRSDHASPATANDMNAWLEELFL